MWSGASESGFNTRKQRTGFSSARAKIGAAREKHEKSVIPGTQEKLC